MIVKVKKIPVRHGGQRYLADEEFTISQAHYEKIKKFVDIVDDSPGTTDDQEPKSIEELTIPQLKAFAEEKGIDLGDATKKDDILSLIQAALKE